MAGSHKGISAGKNNPILIDISDALIMEDQPINVGQNIAIQALTSAIATGVTEMTKEGNMQLDEWEDGNINGKEFTVRVVKKGAATAAKSGGKTLAALTLREGVNAIGKKFGKDIAKRLGNHTFTAIAFGIVEQGSDTILWMNGQLNVNEYKVNTAGNVGSVSGAAVGAVLGAAIPVPVLGSLLGSMLGGHWGNVMGRSIGQSFFIPEQHNAGETEKEDSTNKDNTSKE